MTKSIVEKMCNTLITSNTEALLPSNVSAIDIRENEVIVFFENGLPPRHYFNNTPIFNLKGEIVGGE